MTLAELNGSATAVPDTASQTAVVGGGMMGLVCALHLAEAGNRVTLFEAAPQLGGLAEPWTIGDVTWDRHYHVTLHSDHQLRALLAQLGLEREIVWREPKTAFYSDDALHSMSNLGEFLQFPALGWFDKLRLGSTILYGSRVRDGLRLEDIPVDKWLSRLSGKRAFEKIWKPLLRAKLGDRYSDASAAFIWTILVRMYGARRNGVGREQFGYVPGGYSRIIRTLAARLDSLGVRVRTGVSVQAVHRGDVGPVVELASGERMPFARAIVTLPATRAAKVCVDLTPDETSRLADKRYMGIVCASLLIDESIGPYYITNLTEPWVPFSAVINMSAVVDRSEFGGRALTYLPKYVAPDDPIFARTDDDILKEFIAALARIYPNFDPASVRAARVSRVREVFPVATLGYSRRLPPVVTTVPGLFVVNSAHIVNGTLNVDETIRVAEFALRTMRVLQPA